jgi:hypothetical protein
MTMKSETQKDVAHLLDDQLPNIRRAFDDASKAGCKDPVVWRFNLELRDSLEVACGIFGERLREPLKGHQSGDAIPSCLLPTERQVAIDCLAARLPSTNIAQIIGKPQAAETIRVLVFYGADAAVFDVPRRGDN